MVTDTGAVTHHDDNDSIVPPCFPWALFAKIDHVNKSEKVVQGEWRGVMVNFFRGVIFLLGGILLSAQNVYAKERTFIVKMKKEMSTANAQSIFRKFKFRYKKKFDNLNMYVVSHYSKRAVKKFYKKMKANIDYVEEDYPVRAFVAPSDPLFSSQNGMQRLKIQTAWDSAVGSYDVVVAVSDTGVNMHHPDLKNQIWENSDEIPDNGIDDDGNGYIDDVFGWNFFDNNNNPTDKNGHGSHVAGIIGAQGDNGLGISGVNWRVKIMPLQFLDAKGRGSTSGGIATIIYAADNGASVLNASWGGGDSSRSLRDAIDYATSKGMLVIAAAGNSSDNNDATPSYPASHDVEGLISVASSAGYGRLSNFSNYGLISVDLVAPGSNILSTVLGSAYKRYSGTSMATPMVVGTAALIKSFAPQLTVMQLKNALLNAVDQQGTYAGKLATEGDLNASIALDQLKGGFQIWPKNIVVGFGQKIRFVTYNALGAVSWSISDETLGSIDKNGLFTANSNTEGMVSMSALNENGDVASTETVKIVKVKAGGGGGGGGGGCSKAHAANGTGSSSDGFTSVFSYLLIFLAIRYYGRQKTIKN